MTFTDFIDYADKVGLITVLFIILYGGIKKKWVWGWQYQECQEIIHKLELDRDAWRNTALKTSGVATDAFTELHRR